MSPRAAWRLESLGFERVFDYVNGKADWIAAGLPVEGGEATVPSAADAADREPVTTALNEWAGDVARRMEAAGADQALVVNDARIVLGRVRAVDLDENADALVESVMEPGPTTIRPKTPLADIEARLRKRDVSSVVVTTSDGRLVGVLDREHAAAVLADEEGSCLCSD